MTRKEKVATCTEVLTMLSVLLYSEHVILMKSFHGYDKLEDRYLSPSLCEG